MEDQPRPPARPLRHQYHGVTHDDPYAWLRDPSYPQVTDPAILGYLNAENAYFAAGMAPHQGVQATILGELQARLDEDDQGVPVKDGEYCYQWRFSHGGDYRHWWRWPAQGGDEALFFDEPARAEGHDHYSLRGLEISPDDRLLAFAEDRDGSERFTIKVKSLESGELLADSIANTAGRMVWAQDASGFFYVELSPQLRPWRVRWHGLGAATDPIVYAEADPGFFVGVDRSQSREMLLIRAGDHASTEVRFLPLATPQTQPRLIAPRRAGHEYDVDHAAGRLLIRSNDRHKNFRIVTADPEAPGEAGWRELVAPSDDAYIRGFCGFKHRVAVELRERGLDQIWLQPYDGGGHRVDFKEDVYTASLGDNPEYDVAALRLNFSSLITPATVYDYAVAARSLAVRKLQKIPSGYDPGRYRATRRFATARDGTEVPVSIVHAKNTPLDGTSPLHLYGYGAYGIGMTPHFSSNRLSLLDRGFVYAIAHVRGGDEIGHRWVEGGKLFQRWNSFTDFIDVAHFLVKEGYGSAGNISISGGSAGGTLMGVSANVAPDLWRAVVAHVPFVDVLNTMLDDSLPLTPIEWPEWGNPRDDAAAFAFIRSYSPYDNVAAQDYPPILVTAGLNDPRVTYWEAAKWVARLRAEKTDANPLYLKVNMGAGHAGRSGRYQRLEEIAEEYTFILAAFGKE